MIHYYSPQARAVEAFLYDIQSSLPRRDLHAVHEARQLAGLEGGVFMEIVGHPQPVPPEMRHMIATCGMIVVTYNDAHARAVARRRMERMGIG